MPYIGNMVIIVYFCDDFQRGIYHFVMIFPKMKLSGRVSLTFAQVDLPSSLLFFIFEMIFQRAISLCDDISEDETQWTG